MKIITLIVSHYDYESVLFQYEWHKALCQNVQIMWNIFGLKDVPETDLFIKIYHPNLYKRLAHVYSSIVKDYKDYDADYYLLMEPDAFIIEKNFDAKCIEYMFNQKIDAMFPTFTPGIPMISQSSILGFVVISKPALLYYNKNYDVTVWHELDFVRCLAKQEFRVSHNPFIDGNVFKYLEDKKSLSILDIKKFMKTTCVIHPVKADKYYILNEIKDLMS